LNVKSYQESQRKGRGSRRKQKNGNQT
jgi:hypothetical protein